MDENGMRTLLRETADTDLPPARVDLDQAIAAGRQQRRMRLAGIAGSAVAVVAVAVVIAVSGVVSPASPPRKPIAPSASGQVSAPDRFNPLVPYAAFSRLPAGWHVGQKSSFPGNDLMAASTTTQLSLQVWAPDGAGALTVYPAGQCRSAASTLLCPLLNEPWQKLSRAPDVNGRPAYWLGLKGTSPGSAVIGWQYAPGAWALLGWGYSNTSEPHPAGAVRAVLRSLAADVRFGQTTPILFPYTIHGLAGWQITEVDYTMVNGQPSARMLHLAGGQPAGLIQVNAVPASIPLDGRCDRRGMSLDGHTTLDGVTVDLFAPKGQVVCGDDIDGLQVELIFEYQQRGHTGSGTALGYARHLNLLGADQATWRPYPLR